MLTLLFSLWHDLRKAFTTKGKLYINNTPTITLHLYKWYTHIGFEEVFDVVCKFNLKNKSNLANKQYWNHQSKCFKTQIILKNIIFKKRKHSNTST